MNKRLTAAQVAKELGVSTSFIRIYSRKGLIRFHLNEANGYRYYNLEEVRQDVLKTGIYANEKES